MWLTIELISALYILSFVWLWSLCRLSVPDKSKAGYSKHEPNLIPFERGIKANTQKNSEISA
jgi:hypothetical protein